MALNPSTHAHSSTHASHASHASHAHASHAASKARSALNAQEGEGGGFAAQLLKAHPAASKEAKASGTAEARPKADAAKKPAEDKQAKAESDAKDEPADKDGKDGKPADAKTPPLDPAALLAMQQAPVPVAPSTASLADKSAATGERDEFATDPLGALRKAAAGKAGKDDARQALPAGLAAGPQATPAFAAAGAPGAASKGDIAAALAKADGAVKAATEARDALAAMLPQPDPVTVQAGAVGAPANALLDANQAMPAPPPAAPAQATLTMPPQAPTFAPALGQQIDVWMKGGVQHAEVQLSPQDLGPIRVRIEMEGAHTRVQMSADVASTRDALQQAMPQLSAQLGEVGLSLSGGGVSDQPAFQQAQAQAGNGGDGSGRFGRPATAGQPAGRDGGPDDLALASTARQQAQRRGLLDMYA